ncbi:caspase-13-like protein [Lates japonicus]|uniref:Caspase-13-like protein n=1 Tax=Lates japonicus TaxID=270547 RepID=A0AAD3QXQ4_LATJO|nr:caspase-13-like protein [Lates japonicus]
MTALHCQARLRWCRQHVHWNLNMWSNVMFSDESRFCLQLDRRVKVWRRCRERYADCCTDRVTSFGGGRAGFIRDYLQNLGMQRMEWPASSPDLNPIEHVWDQFGRAVRARVTNNHVG